MRSLIAVILLMVTCRAEETNLIKPGEELIYAYKANIQAGTNNPVEFVSEYFIEANLYLQGLESNVINVQLTNISYKLHNGPIRPQHSQPVPIPIESNLLSKPFKINYNSRNLITGLKFSDGEGDWSMNLKRGIASTLQVDQNSQGEVTEDSIYGLCQVRYDWIRQNNATKLIKAVDLDRCFDTGTDITTSGVDLEYTFKDYEIESMKSVNEILVYMNSVAMSHVKTMQKLTLLGKNKALSKLDAGPTEVFSKSLKYVGTYEKCRDLGIEEPFDQTGGRQVNNPSSVDEVDNLMDDLMEYLDINHITIEAPNLHEAQIVHRVLRSLEKLDLTTLTQYLETIDEAVGEPNLQNHSPKFQNFMHLLPFVGSTASAILIRNFVKINLPQDRYWQKAFASLVREFAQNVRCSSKKLLAELKDLMELGESGWTIRRASVLAISTLVRKTFEGKESDPELEEWIGLFHGQITGNESYSTKLLHMQALANIEIGSASKLLEDILHLDTMPGLKDSQLTRLKILTLWALKPQLIKQPAWMLRVCWPIITNRKLDTTYRITAYAIYVKTEKLSLNSFLSLNVFLKSDTSDFIANFHYNTMKTFSEIPELKDIGRIVLGDIRKPIEIMKTHGIYTTESSDGFRVEAISIDLTKNSLTEVIIKSRSGKEVISFLANSRSTYFKEIISFIAESQSAYLNSFPQLIHMFFHSIDCSEFIFRRTGFTTSLYNDHHVPLLDLIFLSISKNSINIPFLTEQTVYTPLGVPVKYFDNIALGIKGSDNETREYYKFKLNFNGVRSTGVEVYNPVVDLWHGSQEVKLVTLSIPFRVDVGSSKKRPRQLFTLTWRRLANEEIMGVLAYAQNQVYVNGEKAFELLKQFNGQVDCVEVVTRGKDYQRKISLTVYKSEIFGKKIDVQIFDCEQPVTRGSIINEIKKNFKSPLNYLPEFTIINQILTLKRHIILNLGIGSCGISSRLLPLDSDTHHFEIVTDVDDQPNNVLETIIVGIKVLSVDNKTLSNFNGSFYFAWNWKKKSLRLGCNVTLSDWDVQSRMGLDIKFHFVDSESRVDLVMTGGEGPNFGSLQVNLSSGFSDEQKLIMEGIHSGYTACEPNEIPLLSKQCIEAATSHRNLMIKYQIHGSKPPLIQQFLNRILYFGYKNMDYVLEIDDFKATMSDFMDSNKTEIKVTYPLIKNEWNLIIRTENTEIKFIGMPKVLNIPSFELEVLTKEVISFSYFFGSHSSPLLCTIGNDVMLNNQREVLEQYVSTEWQVYWKNDPKFESQWMSVDLRRVNNTLSLRLNKIFSSAVITPKGLHDFEIVSTGNETAVPLSSRFGEFVSSVEAMVIKNPRILLIRHEGMNLAFDGYSLRLNIPSYLLRMFQNQNCMVAVQACKEPDCYILEAE